MSSLSLRFNHEEFCDRLYVRRKTSEEAVFCRVKGSFLWTGKVSPGPRGVLWVFRETSRRVLAAWQACPAAPKAPKERGVPGPVWSQAVGVVAPLPWQP